MVRVVSSMDKKLKVKPKFLDIFQEENYPTEFPVSLQVQGKRVIWSFYEFFFWEDNFC